MNTILCALLIPACVALIALVVHHGDRLVAAFLGWLDGFCRRLYGLPVGDSTAPGALSPPRADDSGLRPEIPHRVLANRGGGN